MKRADIPAVYRLLKRHFDTHDSPVKGFIRTRTNEPFRVLVSTVLSARSRDASTLKVCARLFTRIRDFEDLARFPEVELERELHPLGFFRAKARHLKALPEAIQRLFGGRIPDTIEELIKLPGVGRKTANLIVSEAFGKPGICVDVHVHRICNRLGLIRTKTPRETERELRRILPLRHWRGWNRFLVAFGQTLCYPRNPQCPVCPIRCHCDFGRPTVPQQKRRKCGVWLGMVMMAAGVTVLAANHETPIRDEEAQEWLTHLIPLPKKVAIPAKLNLPPGGIGVCPRPDAGPVERNAVRELSKWLEAATGVAPTGTAFVLTLGVLDDKGALAGESVDGAADLYPLPNREQAYLIRPAEGGKGLVLAALSGEGVYYAAQTLIQLLAPSTSRERVEMPLLTVLDWPDIAERGLWNQNSPDLVYENAAIKLNFFRIGTDLRVSPSGNTAVIPRKDLMLKSRLRAIRYLPTITHLNFLHRLGLFEVHPELMGKGDRAFAGQYLAHGGDPKAHPAPCASQPALASILADWMMAIAAGGATECGCWLTERPAQCGCATCLAEGQFVQEARAFITAWRKTQKRYPGFVIRLFLSTTTDERYDRIMAELPAGVKIERACALNMERVRAEPRDRFVNALLDPYAAKGVWIASYDVPITANGAVDTPEFKLPESSAHRIRAYVAQLAERRYSGAYGMLAFGLSERICDLNITALAEYAWNAKGRSERDLAMAWAVRRGCAQPEKVADWAERIGPLEYDIYDAEFPTAYSWGLAAQRVQQRQRPSLGEGMFRYFRTREDFERKLGDARKALAIAGTLEKPEFALETKVLISYIELARTLFEIRDAAACGEKDGVTSHAVQGLKLAGTNNVNAIREWRRALGSEPWHPRVEAAIRATERTVDDVTRSLETPK